jgi:hypothetical protein
MPEETKILRVTQSVVMEWALALGVTVADPFNTLAPEVKITHETGQSWRVPAYWAGGQEWRVRFAPPLLGKYTTVLGGELGGAPGGAAISIQAVAAESQNTLVRHGNLRVAENGRSLEYADGTPFFWLGDTWWMGLSKRLTWPEGFQQLAADRVAKGFSVVQIIAGPYPDMPEFDPRNENEAGQPWEVDYARINPAYYDQADLRIAWLVRQGLTPCIVGMWGYYLPFMGVEKVKQHWRNLVARWGAYPVIWCLAGEATMPYYLSENKKEDEAAQREGWTEIARYVRSLDSFHRLITIHSSYAQSGRDQVLDDSLIDINMLQPGHSGYESVQNAVAEVSQEYKRLPAKPVLVSEANYEGIIHFCEAETQRLTFWSSVLCGGFGFTYGANGLWQFNTREKPYGPSPHGNTWGNTPWEDAYQLPGSAQLGLAKRLIERYAFWRFEPHPEWVDPCGSAARVDLPFAAGIPGEVRLIYFFSATWGPTHHVLGFEPGARYRAFFWNPRCGEEHELGLVPDAGEASWTIPAQPELKDWVVVLERVKE